MGIGQGVGTITSSGQRTVFNLVSLVQDLPAGERELFERIFRLDVTQGQLKPPDEMRGWIEGQFGSIDAVTSQKIVRVTNLITMEGAIFNQLRADRPIERRKNSTLRDGAAGDQDPFRTPYQSTPEDVFGRIKGRYCVSASNVAKFDGFHGLLIFDEPDPLKFNEDQVRDYIDTGLRWAQAARKVDEDAKYFLFMWNCLGRAGASLSHGHAQVVLTRGMHFAKIESLRRDAINYKDEHGSDYFEDLFAVHQSLGCGFESEGVRLFASLTPIKEREVILATPTLSDNLIKRLYEVLACFRDSLGVVSFNVAIYMPPLSESEESWEAFPVQVRVVDRGDPKARASDWGAMEMYAQSVVASDPFSVAAELKGLGD